MSAERGMLCGRVVRWHEPTADPGQAGPFALDVWDTDLGIWLTLAQADLEEDAMAQGIPVLRGPYVVDYTDIPHDGDKKTLWTPQVGDVLLRLFPDWKTAVQWDCGNLYVGQDVDGTVVPFLNVITWGSHGLLGRSPSSGLDSVMDAANNNPTDGTGTNVGASATIFSSTDPLQIQLAQTPGIDPTRGHVELYALVARAVAP